jgi:hypothetical protein
MNQDRRGFRFSCEAPAEVAPEDKPNAVVTARATELSLHGCYLETLSPFPIDTPVLVKIFQSGEYFEAKGTVIYVKPAAGMGLEFRDIKPHCKNSLQKWILAALHERRNEESGE